MWLLCEEKILTRALDLTLHTEIFNERWIDRQTHLHDKEPVYTSI